ncbi:hypothetical protein FPZ12_029600 [Amycolatopsis acidicola]|uniref:Uncharacterized protein n=1 Tax=Amycolatopsis acidicola TaxID=2596893 RepID=A0A5N0UXT2_9PSEU|nr:hypothetical protein [Amycolatopsis acidicola]KAA9155553.1 hypothetical protein FPZ12_029600 [Amycolatopsis acidicola]
MKFDDYFWIGPLGQLMPMSVPEGNVDRTPVRAGSSSTSLNGRTTTNRRGTRNAWSLEQAYLSADDVGFLEAIYEGLIEGQPRLIDPLLKNRLKPSVAAPRVTTTFNGAADAWAVSAGGGLVVDSRSASFPSAALAGLPKVTYTQDFRPISYSLGRCVCWNVGTGASPTMYPNGALLSTGKARASRVDPVRPGETVTYWVLACRATSASGTVTLTLDKVAADGTITAGTATASITGTAWTQYAITYTVPTDGSVAGVVPRWTGSSSSLQVVIGLSQMEEGSVPTLWQPGYGAPEIDITDFKSSSPLYPLANVSLSIQEL